MLTCCFLVPDGRRFVKLGVRLLHEQAKGPQSELYEYLKQLPRKVDSPVNWSQELVQQLQYPHLVHKVTEQQREWAALYGKFLEQGAVDKTSAPSQQDFFRALSLVRSRTFSGPYVASTLSDRLRLAGLVGGLVAANTLLGGDLSKGLGAAAAVFLFNVIYELVLSSKLRQYAMCPVIDIMNHSSLNTVRTSGAVLCCAVPRYSEGQQEHTGTCNVQYTAALRLSAEQQIASGAYLGHPEQDQWWLASLMPVTAVCAMSQR